MIRMSDSFLRIKTIIVIKEIELKLSDEFFFFF